VAPIVGYGDPGCGTSADEAARAVAKPSVTVDSAMPLAGILARRVALPDPSASTMS
jgi:hypothetical protein